jgi:Xaa-Pro aminopeptidase
MSTQDRSAKVIPLHGSATPPAAPPKAAMQDTTWPQALLDFMMRDWAPPARRATPRVRGHERFAARRQALSALFPGELLLIPTGHEKVRSNDTAYAFRPGSDFYYLTGNLEPDCVLALVPSAERGHESWLFVEPNERNSPTFFTDRVKGELWVGPRLGVARSRERYQVDRCLPLPELTDRLLHEAAGTAPHRVLRGFSARADELLAERKREDSALATTLSEMRLIKDSLEVRALERAIASTRRAFEDVVRALKGARTERVVEGVFNLRARVEGNDVGYRTIAAAGDHATILHWTHNDGALDSGALLLLDAGVEGNELYTADVTRTLPLSGKFSPAQRAIYELVLEAQRAAFKEVRPGLDFMAPNRAAMKVLAEGLQRLGILRDAAKALREENQFYRRYSLHNVSHMLGIDVHDCAKARAEAYKFGELRTGMVLTVEPGLYFQRNDLTVPAKYRGIGVRIEDDVLVTARGCRILTDAFPRETNDVERWVKRGRSAHR